MLCPAENECPPPFRRKALLTTDQRRKHEMKRILYLTSIFVALFFSCSTLWRPAPATTVAAQGVPTIESRFTAQAPTIDGHFQPGEWDQATVEPFTFFMSDAEGNSTVLIPADLLLLNDQMNLYLGLRILGVQYNNPSVAAGTGFDVILLLFDNNNNGTHGPGEDEKYLFSIQGNIDYAQRGAYADLHVVPESPDNGDLHLDGLGRIVHSNVTGTGDYTAEFVLPLNSGDPNDIAVTPNDPIRFNVLLATKCCEASSVELGGLFGFEFEDSSGWGIIRVQPGQAPPDPAPQLSGTITCITNEFGDGRQIYVMNADGTDVSRRTQGDQALSAPFLSSDGQKIVYTAARPDPDPETQERTREIYTINARRGRAQRLTNNAVAESHPVFSPNGQQIAFVREGNIWVMSATGRDARQLTNVFADSDLIWAADGRIVFTTVRWNGIMHIAVMNADGSNVIQLTRNEKGSLSPRVSPDGQWVTFFRYDGPGPFFNFAVSLYHPWNIYRIRIDGTDEQRLTNDGLLNFLPAFSPDGRGILYQKVLDVSSFYTVLYYLDLQTGRSRRVVDRLSRVETFDWR
jgi:Tol biopolymer transport system component